MIDWLLGAAVKRDSDPSVAVGDTRLPLAIRRHPRATRLTMRLAPDGSEVRITMPRWGRTADALAFAESRAEWLAGQIRALPAAIPPAPGNTLAFRGQQVLIDWATHHRRTPQLDGDRLAVGGPQDTLQPRLRRWLEGQALDLFAEDLAFYCARAELGLPDLRLSRATRRWGSCSGKGCIRLNWRLVQAPDPVRRSVVAHEVAHLTHFDHSPAFHARLAQLFEGDVSATDRWLKREGRGLYAAFG